MAFKELIFDAKDFPERLRGMELMDSLPCRQVYALKTLVPKVYIVLASIEPKPQSLTDIYGCDEVVGMEFDFMNGPDTTIDDKEREGVIHNILRTNGLLNKQKEWKRDRL